MNPPSLGYVILYVNDVAASLTFYEKAFGLKRRFFHDDNGKAYGELETGATRLCEQPWAEFCSPDGAVSLASREIRRGGAAKPPNQDNPAKSC